MNDNKLHVTEEEAERIRQLLLEFKVRMLKKEPFYGDVLMRIPIMEDESIGTAATNGRWIKYNPGFFATLPQAQRNFVLLHEVLHVILKHWKRGGERRSDIWNIACDYVVNDMLRSMRSTLRREDIDIEPPKDGVYCEDYNLGSTEEVYQRLLNLNEKSKTVMYEFIISDIPKSFSPNRQCKPYKLAIRSDLILSGEGEEAGYDEITEGLLDEMLKDAIRKSRGMGRCRIPGMTLALTETKRLPWDKILYEFLEDKISEESSYFTPERKYLHMDLIVPGLGSREEELGDFWAFIDSSASVGGNDLNQFITQLARIGKQFNCHINLAYWDVDVGKVYTQIKDVKQLLNSVPGSRGGTDINCVYEYIRENKIRPAVLLILTDGYFGRLSEGPGGLRKKTILVISEKGYAGDEVKELGRIASL